MDGGRVIEHGDVFDVFSEPAEPVVAEASWARS